MFLSYLTLAVALCLSVIAAYYSIAGLAAIFAAAVIPIIIMGSILEVGKVVVTLWLHEYWSRCRWIMKLYLVPAVAVLMLITSMGIFGFLSKAHSDQSLVGGDVQAQIAIYDEKIKTARDNIDANRKALKQMDEAVDQVMGRSQDEKGADKAVALRRAQQKERARLQSEIQAEQKTITGLTEERAPIAADVRKIEAEVGPLKYIAKLIYGDNPDANLLEKAVTWVIIIIVAVFDPLAIMMLLAATESLKWHRSAARPDSQDLKDQETPEAEVPDPPAEAPKKWSYLEQGEKMFFRGLTPMPSPPVPTVSKPMMFQDPGEHPQDEFESDLPETEPTIQPEFGPQLELDLVPNVADQDQPWDEEEHPAIKEAIKQWKKAHPQDTLKNQRSKLARGEIDQLPWMSMVAQADNLPDNTARSGFGISFPDQPRKGDMFVRVDKLPNQLYKHNGHSWIMVDKNLTDSYTYDTAYLDHLISAIDRGEYDIELLNDVEREQIAQRLSTKPNT